MTNLNKLAETAVNGLEKSMLGGIKKESAVKAIKDVAEEGSRQIEQLTQTASSQSARITGLSQEVKEATQQLKNANASLVYAQGELATKDKALVETTEQLTKTKADLSDAKSTKKGVSKLKDGSIQEISVNKNGTRMKKIIGANGNLKSYEVEQLDGSVRKNEFDSISGKRVQTKTNTTGEEVTMDYDLAGKNTKVSTNVDPKPTLVNRERVDGKIVEEFSDGSKIVRSKIREGESQIENFDKVGNRTELYQELEGKDYKQTYHVKYNENESVVTGTYENANFKYTREHTISTNDAGEKFVSSAKFKSEDGEIVYKPTQTDMMGNVIKAEAVATYKLPKDADGKHIKTVKTSYDIDNSNKLMGPKYHINTSTVMTKDGSRLEKIYNKEHNLVSQNGYDSDGSRDVNLKIKIQGLEKNGREPLAAEFLDLDTSIPRNGIFLI